MSKAPRQKWAVVAATAHGSAMIVGPFASKTAGETWTRHVDQYQLRQTHALRVVPMETPR